MNFNFSKKRVIYKPRNTVVHRFDKVMYVSCIQISHNFYELSVLLNYTYSFKDIKTLIPIKVIIDNETYLKINKKNFGVWIKYNSSLFNSKYLYIYQSLNDNKLIFKTTKNDNYLNNNSVNQYNHKLIFKGFLSNSNILEYIN